MGILKKIRKRDNYEVREVPLAADQLISASNEYWENKNLIVALSVFVIDMILFTPTYSPKASGFEDRQAFYIFDSLQFFSVDFKRLLLDFLIIGTLATIAIIAVSIKKKI